MLPSYYTSSLLYRKSLVMKYAYRTLILEPKAREKLAIERWRFFFF